MECSAEPVIVAAKAGLNDCADPHESDCEFDNDTHRSEEWNQTSEYAVEKEERGEAKRHSAIEGAASGLTEPRREHVADPAHPCEPTQCKQDDG